jgi:hypothetical protein
MNQNEIEDAAREVVDGAEDAASTSVSAAAEARSELEGLIAEASDIVTAAAHKVEAAKGEMAVANRALDALLFRQEQTTRREVRNLEGIRNYLQSQQRLRMEKAEQQKVLVEAGLIKPGAASLLDRALNRRKRQTAATAAAKLRAESAKR